MKFQIKLLFKILSIVQTSLKKNIIQLFNQLYNKKDELAQLQCNFQEKLRQGY